MRSRLALLAVVAGATLAVAAPAHATNECRGFQVCVPVAGPWVIAPGGLGARTQYQLACPRRYIVGGLDAELTSKSLDLSFVATLGSPVNPGISTSQAVVFVATKAAGGGLPSFRPHIGCIPASGGGGRSTTAYSAVFPPGQPTVFRIATVQIPGRPGVARVTHACAAGERLIAESYAVGFLTQAPPTPRIARAVRVSTVAVEERVRAVVQAAPAITGTRAEVQIQALCAVGKP
jgi:hypothetical protein